MPKDFLARAVSQLETDDAAYVLEGLEEAEKQDLLARMPARDRLALKRNLEYPEETAGRLMQTDFVAVPPFWTVGQVIDHMRETEISNRDFLYECTPGYYNNEGGSVIRSHLGEVYGPGFYAFGDLLRKWRDEGDMAGLELKP